METDLEEERRLLYVAMTRAGEELILTSPGDASIFVKQLPDGILIREQARQREKSWDAGQQLSLFDKKP